MKSRSRLPHDPPSRSHRNKKAKEVGKFPTLQDRIAELRVQAYTRDGRNAMIARAILKELDRPLRKRESDRALGRRLGVDHRTIGRWRERLKGQRHRRGIASRRKFLGLCHTLAGLNVVIVSQKLVPNDIRKYVVPAYRTLHRFQYGPKTMPDRQTRPRASSKRPAAVASRMPPISAAAPRKSNGRLGSLPHSQDLSE